MTRSKVDVYTRVKDCYFCGSKTLVEFRTEAGWVPVCDSKECELLFKQTFEEVKE